MRNVGPFSWGCAARPCRTAAGVATRKPKRPIRFRPRIATCSYTPVYGVLVPRGYRPTTRPPNASPCPRYGPAIGLRTGDGGCVTVKSAIGGEKLRELRGFAWVPGETLGLAGVSRRGPAIPGSTLTRWVAGNLLGKRAVFRVVVENA